MGPLESIIQVTLTARAVSWIAAGWETTFDIQPRPIVAMVHAELIALGKTGFLLQPLCKISLLPRLPGQTASLGFRV